MTNILVIWQGRLAGAVAPSTGKIMKNIGKNLLQNGIQNFVFWLIHSWEIALQSQIFDIFWKKAQKKAPALKGLNSFCQFYFYSRFYDGANWANVLPKEKCIPVLPQSRNDKSELEGQLKRYNRSSRDYQVSVYIELESITCVTILHNNTNPISINNT